MFDSIGDVISKLGPSFVWSSVAWLIMVDMLTLSIIETATYGFRMTHVFKSKHLPAEDFARHQRWANRVLMFGVASFMLTRVVTSTAHAGFPAGWTLYLLIVHITVGAMCVGIYLLARFWLTGVRYPKIHHRIVRVGVAAFVTFVYPTGLFFYGLILYKVLLREHFL